MWVTPFYACIILKHNILPYIHTILQHIKPRLEPEPAASPCQGLARLGLEWVQLSELGSVAAAKKPLFLEK